MNQRLSMYLEQEILSATGLQLVHLLYQAAISEIRDARRNLAEKQIERRCRNISRACDIVGELRSALNPEQGGEIAQSLEALYCYMLERLLEANLKQEDRPLAEVLGLLSTLDEAWKQIASATPDAVSGPVPHQAFSVLDGIETSTFAWSL